MYKNIVLPPFMSKTLGSQTQKSSSICLLWS